MTDHDFERPSSVANAEGYMLTQLAMRWFWDQYVNSVGEMAHAPPLRATDLSGLPCR